jgi:hypothetical protein
MFVGVGLAALVAVSVIVALLGGSEAVLLPEDTPEGTVQRYLQAMEAGDFREAYSYLGAGLTEVCDYQQFRGNSRWFESAEQRITLEDSEDLGGGEVEVRVRVTQFSVDPPFGSREYSHTQPFTLVQEAGLWRFSESPWPLGPCHKRLDEPAPARTPAPTPEPMDRGGP